MSESTVCYQCGVRRPTKGMILVEPVPVVDDETEDLEEMMWFCNWKCLSNYALDIVTP